MINTKSAVELITGVALATLLILFGKYIVNDPVPAGVPTMVLGTGYICCTIISEGLDDHYAEEKLLWKGAKSTFLYASFYSLGVLLMQAFKF